MKAWAFYIVASLGLGAVIYSFAFTIYATAHRVRSNQLSDNFLRLHRGAIWYRDDTYAGYIAFTCFYPANWFLYHADGIDMQVHTGDSFGYEFCQGDYID